MTAEKKYSFIISIIKDVLHVKRKISSFTFFIFLFASNNLSAQSGWFQVHPYSNGQYVTTNTLRSVWFLNEKRGFVVGINGTVLRTNDAGSSWSVVDLGLLGKTLTSVVFADSLTGYIGGYDGTLYKTVNGGLSWTTFNLPSYFHIESLTFIEKDTGWAAGWLHSDANPLKEGGFILGTNDGGIVWPKSKFDIDTTMNPYKLWWRRIQFPSPNVGYAIDFYGRFTKTTDGGKSWTTSVLPLLKGWLNLFFVNEAEGIVSGDGSKIMKTTDGGYSWVTPQNPRSSVKYGLFFTNDSIGYICGQLFGTIWKTTDSGVHWFEQTASNPLSNSFYDIFFVDQKVGWTVGDKGVILKTENGGLTDTEVLHFQPEVITIESVYPNPVNRDQRAVINYQLQEHGLVEMKLYDLFGREIKTLINEIKDAGMYQVQLSPASVNSGMYFIKLHAGNFSAFKKLVVLQ